MNTNLISLFSDLDAEESSSVKAILDGLDEGQQAQFATIYLNKRRDASLILVCILAGFVGFAGLHRFITDRIGLGLLYFFTGGFLLIGTIIDLFRYKKITRKYNTKMALDTATLLGIWKN
jgi:TM2 domain-containing membrane protein YozV